jgi:hypothetical protein
MMCYREWCDMSKGRVGEGMNGTGARRGWSMKTGLSEVEAILIKKADLWLRAAGGWEMVCRESGSGGPVVRSIQLESE